LSKSDHPFLAAMDFVFQTDERIMFAMKFLRGGELFSHLKTERQFPEDRTKFYVVQIALALGHLHERKIVYRDLKPENILMDTDGYVCLTDFGIAKDLTKSETATTFCGTFAYMSPEIISKTKYSFEVDWWALGILTYEMMVGFPPFLVMNSAGPKPMFELIKKQQVIFPDAKKHGIAMSDEVKDFILQCLSKNASSRLGS